MGVQRSDLLRPCVMVYFYAQQTQPGGRDGSAVGLWLGGWPVTERGSSVWPINDK